MAGSPKKRAREKARRLAEADAAEVASSAAAAPLPATTPVAEVLPPESEVEVTRTAFKRAMRRAAEKHAERAMEILADAMECPDPRISVPAAREILDRSIGKPTQELEVGAGGVQVAIIRFSEDNK